MKANFPLPRWLTSTYVGILCLVFGEVYSAQVLGMLGIYRAWSVIPLTLLLGWAAWRVYWSWGAAEFFGGVAEERALPGRLNGVPLPPTRSAPTADATASIVPSSKRGGFDAPAPP